MAGSGKYLLVSTRQRRRRDGQVPQLDTTCVFPVWHGSGLDVGSTKMDLEMTFL